MFLRYAYCSVERFVTGRVLLTSTKTMSGNLRATLRSQDKAIRIVDWDHLSSSQVNWNEFETVNSQVLKVPRSLRPHQNRTLKSVVSGFEN